MHFSEDWQLKPHEIIKFNITVARHQGQEINEDALVQAPEAQQKMLFLSHLMLVISHLAGILQDNTETRMSKKGITEDMHHPLFINEVVRMVNASEEHPTTEDCIDIIFRGNFMVRQFNLERMVYG